METILNGLINSSLFFLSWLGIEANQIAMDEGKNLINCKAATIQRDIQIKYMVVGEKGWGHSNVNSVNHRVSKICGGSYTTLITKLDKDVFMFEHKGDDCEYMKKINRSCWQKKTLR